MEDIICELVGAEAATIVNNNAAAVLLVLAAFAQHQQVIISRGELVEIGGAFRMPEIMASASCKMIEVGTTNRTHLFDYENAIIAQTAAIITVHCSNYSIEGFTQRIAANELAALKKRKRIALISDLGSGALINLSHYGLPKEPLVQEMLKAGCDVVMFSGDKLLGGPQCGIIVGKKKYIEKIKKHPLKRALRVSKLPLAALEATLRLYQQPESLAQTLPTLRWLTRKKIDIESTAAVLLPEFQRVCGTLFKVVSINLKSQIGSGALPVDLLDSAGLAITSCLEKKKLQSKAIEQFTEKLRNLPIPIIGHIKDARLLLDCRCIDSVADVIQALQACESAT